jgi:hypothetical protein
MGIAIAIFTTILMFLNIVFLIRVIYNYRYEKKKIFTIWHFFSTIVAFTYLVILLYVPDLTPVPVTNINGVEVNTIIGQIYAGSFYFLGLIMLIWENLGMTIVGAIIIIGPFLIWGYIGRYLGLKIKFNRKFFI